MIICASCFQSPFVWSGFGEVAMAQRNDPDSRNFEYLCSYFCEIAVYCLFCFILPKHPAPPNTRTWMTQPLFLWLWGFVPPYALAAVFPSLRLKQDHKDGDGHHCASWWLHPSQPSTHIQTLVQLPAMSLLSPPGQINWLIREEAWELRAHIWAPTA